MKQESLDHDRNCECSYLNVNYAERYFDECECDANDDLNAYYEL